MTWQRSIVAADGTHHICDGHPLYSVRFSQVQKFHAPGLAPARDSSGAFHITPQGTSAYSARFRQTWGFYEKRAAVEDRSGWLHILPDGRPLTMDRHAWCGNFQEGRCTVRDQDGRYHHIRIDGSPAYLTTYSYAGDFRDGAAVVRCAQRGLCTHIDPDGDFIHDRWLIDLDVFHKGLARARDQRGWFHLTLKGTEAYRSRFAAIEPFYNGTALAETFDERRVLVSLDGSEALQIAVTERATTQEAAIVKVVVIGNIGSGKTGVAKHLADHFGWPFTGIDTLRQQFSDGTAAGEFRAWERFAADSQRADPRVLEFSGSGPMVHLVRHALSRSGGQVIVLWVDTPIDVCLSRIEGRTWETPYPDFGVPMDSVVRDLGQRLLREFGGQTRWLGAPVLPLDGRLPQTELSAQAVRAVTRQLELFNR